MRRGLLLLLVSVNLPLSGGVQLLPPLPAGTFPYSIQTDAAGNIYIAGNFLPDPTQPNGPAHAFAAKLSPDGARVIWWTVLAGSKSDLANALQLGSDNSVYLTGITYSSDFPTTKGSMQPAIEAPSQAFAVKLDPNGTIVYGTYIGGSAQTGGNAIAVDAAGHAFITGGLTGASFPTTPGAVVGATSATNNTAFLIELDPAGSNALVAIAGFGGTAIAVDPQGNIYAAGYFTYDLAPTTPGAFQAGATSRFCYSLGFFGNLPCGNQHVAKINPAGTQLIYATYVIGGYGATPIAMAVDSAGNVILAGNTNSPDYPTTPSAYQPEFFSIPVMTRFGLNGQAPPVAPYITKLNASGTGLLWSTFLAGSGGLSDASSFVQGDTLAGMTIDANGNILINGYSPSRDFPGLWNTPVASRPTFAHPLSFIARLSPDGATLSPTQLLAQSHGRGIAARADGSVVAASPLASVTLSTVGRVAAIADTADNAKIVSVAPGQLLTLFGTNLAPSNAPVTVTFNGIAAPILYTSGIQINVQVPYELAGLTEVTMQVSSPQVSPPVSESYILAVVERQPSVFLAPAAFTQSIFDVSGLQPLALNADGTLNSSANPAAPGSTVTLFLNGLGVTNPAQQTGIISSTLTTIIPGATIYSTSGSPLPAAILSTATLPGSISSIAQVQLQISPAPSVANIPLQIQQPNESPFWVRGQGILIWVSSN
jgi:uncharacterized protein (TIGR03437 family)